MSRFVRFFGVIFLTVFLVACDSAEERAEGHYQNALALAAEGDIDRAIVELRNVFQLDGSHLEARKLIAELHLQNGEIQASYSQYLRLAEQAPENLDARVALAELAFQSTNWDELERHGTKAFEIAPEDPRVQIISTVRAYRAAILEENDTAVMEAVRASLAMARENPNSILLREVITDHYLRTRQFTEALSELDKSIAAYPDRRRYWNQRLQTLIQMGDEVGTEAQLVEMVERFPDDIEQKATLVRYYLSRDKIDEVEDFLRQLSADAEGDNIAPRLDLIRFLVERRGLEAGMAELEVAIATEANPTPFILLKAGLEFSAGERDAAIAALEAILENSEGGEETNNVRVALARMLLETGNEVGARSLVETVLADEPDQLEATKMNARWLIDADDPDAAIGRLRAALDSNADDAELLTLMAEANNRNGSANLARDFLALAVDASGNAPAETIRYAQLLISEERFLPAEDILLDALRLAPNDIDLLVLTGGLYLRMEDFGRVSQVIGTLERIEDPRAQEQASALELQRLERESGTEEAVAYLEALAGGENATFGAQVALVRAKLSTDDFQEAVTLAENLRAENPTNPAATLVLAATVASVGELDRAEELYRSVLDQSPNLTNAWIELARTKLRQGDRDASRAVVDEAIAANPGNRQLLWAKASDLEQQGDYDGAIAIYEELYAADTGNILIANNLASMLATYRDDPDSLEKAWNVARRFRDNPNPAVQDTYGWIAHRRGDSVEAEDYLRNAAAGLPSDPIVQFHYAEVLLALDRKEDALEQYRQVIAIAGATDTRPQIDRARQQLTSLEAELAAE